ncbi:hypothetical protein [Nocardia thailandica]|uniref:hypothetical protein n=1 Tax=Nocardia thailandica TaxID=257275 RepID=UPI0002D53732|nr:hypothetical protein [Nocardia thailandica]
MTDVPLWAAPGTLAGLIQRGHGAGRSAARSDPAWAGALVLACLTDDPRWDQQIEERGWYYATLAMDCGVPAERIGASLRGLPRPPAGYADHGGALVVDVLQHLAARGVPGAIPSLLDYLRSGRRLDLALDALLPFAAHPEASGLLDDLLAVADDETLRDALAFRRDLARAPWSDWRDASPRIDRAIAATARPRAETTTSADRGAFQAAARAAVLRAMRAAKLPRLPDVPAGACWEAALLAHGAELLQDDDLAPAVRRTVRNSLRALRSPDALRWARSHAFSRGPVSATARSMLITLAEPADGPALAARLATALADDDIYTQCDLVPALGRIRYQPSVTTVSALFDTTGYSYLRARAAVALSRMSPAFGPTRAIECLDDSDSGTRELGARFAGREARERLYEAAHDPAEADTVRRAAAARLAGWDQDRTSPPDEGGPSGASIDLR